MSMQIINGFLGPATLKSLIVAALKKILSVRPIIDKCLLKTVSEEEDVKANKHIYLHNIQFDTNPVIILWVVACCP